MKNSSALVLGSGVSGLTTAYALLRAGYKVTIWSKEAAGGTPPTSTNAYAFWLPVKADGDARVERWANEAFEEYRKLSTVAGTGVAMKKILELKITREEPWYAESLKCFRHAQSGEISAEYTDAHVLDAAPVIDPPLFLAWLRKQILSLGGKFVRKEIANLSECPKRFRVIVNCTGLAARELVNDKELFAARLQVLTIKSNGFDNVVFDSEGPNKLACIVPHGDYIKIGALYDERNESMEVDESITAGILERCSKMIPGFKADRSDVLSVTRCLRPKRPMTRVEYERTEDGRHVIHNYGHNGTGYIVSFGSAQEVVTLVSAICAVPRQA